MNLKQKIAAILSAVALMIGLGMVGAAPASAATYDRIYINSGVAPWFTVVNSGTLITRVTLNNFNCPVGTATFGYIDADGNGSWEKAYTVEAYKARDDSWSWEGLSIPFASGKASIAIGCGSQFKNRLFKPHA